MLIDHRQVKNILFGWLFLFTFSKIWVKLFSISMVIMSHFSCICSKTAKFPIKIIQYYLKDHLGMLWFQGLIVKICQNDVVSAIYIESIFPNNNCYKLKSQNDVVSAIYIESFSPNNNCYKLKSDGIIEIFLKSFCNIDQNRELFIYYLSFVYYSNKEMSYLF